MKKYWWIILILVIGIIGCIVFFVYNTNSSNMPNYSAEKSGFNATQNTLDNNSSSDNSLDGSSNTDFKNNTNTNVNKTPSIIEQEIANFSTKITNKKDTNRQGNISITCSALNNTIVNPGETFSFCDVVGDSTPEKGYKEANVIIQGIETKGLGGGNCQVSSTLYNAVLAASDQLSVVERHPHSAPVPYIEEGKDAAVSYRRA